MVKATTDPDKKAMQERQFKSLSSGIAAMEEAIKTGNKDTISQSQSELVATAKDLLSDWLDKQLGATVTSNAIFSKLPKYWEEKYHQDMEALNVRLLMTLDIMS